MDEDAFVKSIMSDLNRNLATERITIERMIEDGPLSYKVRDGSVVEVPREQAEILWDACQKVGAYNLRVPIYVTSDTSGEQGCWRVDGRMESDVVSQLLGKKKIKDDSIRLHHADYRDLRHIIPELILVVFSP